MSSSFIDMAIAAGVPVGPVRFARGLPAEPVEVELQLPQGYGRQDYYLGRPIMPDDLASLPYAERRRVILAAINDVGPPLAEEQPAPSDEGFARAAETWLDRGHTDVQAALLATMEKARDPMLTTLVEHARTGTTTCRDTAGADAQQEWYERMAALVLGSGRPG